MNTAKPHTARETSGAAPEPPTTTAKLPYEAPKAVLVVLQTEERLMACGVKVGCTTNLS